MVEPVAVTLGRLLSRRRHGTPIEVRIDAGSLAQFITTRNMGLDERLPYFDLNGVKIENLAFAGGLATVSSGDSRWNGSNSIHPAGSSLAKISFSAPNGSFSLVSFDIAEFDDPTKVGPPDSVGEFSSEVIPEFDFDQSRASDDGEPSV